MSTSTVVLLTGDDDLLLVEDDNDVVMTTTTDLVSRKRKATMDDADADFDVVSSAKKLCVPDTSVVTTHVVD